MMFGYPFMGRLKIIGLKIQNVTVTLEIAWRDRHPFFTEFDLTMYIKVDNIMRFKAQADIIQ